MEKFFNTEGPIQSDIHYFVDPLSRVDMDSIEMLIRQRKYFVLHAPRQTGKTTMLMALRDRLNAQGEYIALYVNVEAGQAFRNQVDKVLQTTIACIANELKHVVGDDWPYELTKQYRDSESGEILANYLDVVCARLTKPLILFIDEIDSLVGDSLVSVLRQLRSGYPNRPARFPQSIVLCGVRDVRDYRIVLGNQDVVTGGSAFNVKAESLRLGNFTMDEIRNLYAQHTAATGQPFDEACFPMVWDASEGQPWIVNALGYEVMYKIPECRDRNVTITPEMLERAKEQIIYKRLTHIDQLIDKLKEDRVRRIIQPMLACDSAFDENIVPVDDLQYCVDLGLITEDRPRRVANAIYREVIPRELTWTTQSAMAEHPSWFAREDGGVDVVKLLTSFQQFFRENSDSWIGAFDYAEAGPQLLLQAYLQRVVNGGGYIDREYGLGRGRTDLLIRKPLTSQLMGPYQRVVLELKIRRAHTEKVIENGLEQTYAYMDRCGNVDEGHLIIFDRRAGLTWQERIWHEVREYRSRLIHVWGM